LEVTSLRSLQIGGGRGLQAATLLTELLLTLSRRSKRTFNLPPLSDKILTLGNNFNEVYNSL